MKKLFGLLVVFLAVSGLSFGQAVSTNGGSIQGTITDPTGAVVPEAEITIVSADTGSSRSFRTDSAGVYSIGPLVPGNYTLRIEKQGFTSLSIKTVIRTGTATNGNYTLALGDA